MNYQLRPNQKDIIAYQRGRMGVSAVPGSGKTWTLSYLAAEIIANGKLKDNQEILIVTLVNSAVDNFYQRISQFLDQRGLLPQMGFRVRTLHGLAHDIVRERPDLVGLSDSFQILDERETDFILQEVCQAWLNSHPEAVEAYLDLDQDESYLAWIRRDKLPMLLQETTKAFIRQSKDYRQSSEKILAQIGRLPVPLPLAEICLDVYTDYQRALAYRGSVDFDDLTRLALDALEWDNHLLERLQQRWPYILEDEAQDSSRLQEKILEKLTGNDGNWVRVGDPNQAIYETFTTASPKYLLNFLNKPDVIRQELPDSGRSTPSIIRLANYLIAWTRTEHPVEAVRDALNPPFIEAVDEDGQGANPPDQPEQIHLVLNKYNPDEEVQAIAQSLARWLPDHPDETVAVLTPRNLRGFDLVDELHRKNIPVVESLLRSSTSTRISANTINILLNYLSDPQSSNKLAHLFKETHPIKGVDPPTRQRLEHVAELIRKCRQIEEYISPTPVRDWLQNLAQNGEDAQTVEALEVFRRQVRRWQMGILLPIDQLVLTVGQDVFSEPGELALSHKLAILLRQSSNLHPQWRLPELSGELRQIAQNERRFIGFSQDDIGFDPDKYKGQVVVSTIHKAKGLEWDRVYLISANNYDFPSGIEGDQYIGEKRFVRDHLNLPAEALNQLEISLSTDEYHWYQEGAASQAARLDYARERLRLFFVGITRARKELVVSWNSGRFGECQPCLPLLALSSYWDRTRGIEE
ncbi:MAG: ATP-dependent helicase [Anaerolineales bacterium]|nr:ATP-dependent helicase [Anaerolineales bacterium]